jgi:hypothetical protein
MGAIDMYPYQIGNVCATSTDANTGGILRCFSDYQITEYKYNNYAGPCDYMYVSLNERKIDPGIIHLYPNPASTHIIIALKDLQPLGNLQLSITDIYGKQLKQENLEKGEMEHTLELSGLSHGMYDHDNKRS